MASLETAEALRADIPARTDPEVTKAALRTTIHRLSIYAAANSLIFLLATPVLWPFRQSDGLLAWSLLAATTALSSAAMGHKIWIANRIEEVAQLRQAIIWLFAIPSGLAWGTLVLATNPSPGQGKVIVAAVVIFGLAALAAVGSFPVSGLITGASLMFVPTMAWAWTTTGIGSRVSQILILGLLLAGLLAATTRLALLEREVLVLRNRRLISDVSAKKSNLAWLNKKLAYRATHDLLTGLANRSLFQQELDTSLKTARVSDQKIGLLFIDLDRFKFINDTMGHAAGDQLLKTIGERLTNATTGLDALVARVGGDELVILIRDLAAEDDLASIGKKILSLFDDPFVLGQGEISIAASIGVVASQWVDTPDTLYRLADEALYQAKDQGRGRIVHATDELRHRSESRLRTEMNLHTALQEGAIHAFYQPEVDLCTGKILGAESLARMTTASGVDEAKLFIEIARNTGLLEPLTLRVADQVWALMTGADLGIPISLNISCAHLETLLAYHLDDPLRRPLSGMRLEIEETDVIRDFNRATRLLEMARSSGAVVLLDNFGTGFASLRALSDLPIDGIKIDHTYMNRIEHDDKVKSLIASLAEFGRNSNIMIAAEGVETLDQAEFLLQVGIDRAQGYLYSPAVDCETFAEICKAGYAETLTSRPF